MGVPEQEHTAAPEHPSWYPLRQALVGNFPAGHIPSVQLVAQHRNDWCLVFRVVVHLDRAILGFIPGQIHGRLYGNQVGVAVLLSHALRKACNAQSADCSTAGCLVLEIRNAISLVPDITGLFVIFLAHPLDALMLPGMAWTLWLLICSHTSGCLNRSCTKCSVGR